jgi:hypothetical protein
MISGAQGRLRSVSVLTALAFVVALTSFALRVFWWTHQQFAGCDVQIWNKPQPGYCGVVSLLDWVIWYGPLVSLAISAVVLLLRRQRWHSSPFTPVFVFWASALMCMRTALVMLIGFALRDMH